MIYGTVIEFMSIAVTLFTGKEIKQDNIGDSIIQGI